MAKPVSRTAKILIAGIGVFFLLPVIFASAQAREQVARDMIYGAILVLLYFAPSIYAYSVDVVRRRQILMVNLLLGWTVIGWIVAAIWAASPNREPQHSAPSS